MEIVDSVVKFKLIALFILLFSPHLLAAQGFSLFIQEGTASYYAPKFQGKRTASGEVYLKDSLTAAHKLLPFGTTLRVTNQKNGKTVVVKVNDRLPASSKRVIDLSYLAAKEVDMIREGLVQVKIEATTVDQMNKLVDYFEGKPHPNLRLRPYYRPIMIPEDNLEECFFGRL
jgi:rare lipoprotein A